MGFGSKLKKAVKKVGKQIGSGATKTYQEYDRYTSSKTGAYLTPYLSMYDSDGRDALVKAYGGYATVGASAYNPAAGAVVGTAVNAYNARNAQAPTPPSAGSAFAAPIAQPAAPTPAAQDDTVWWILGGISVVALVIGAVLILKKRK